MKLSSGNQYGYDHWEKNTNYYCIIHGISLLLGQIILLIRVDRAPLSHILTH